jgi:hypothetical protein
VPPGAAPPRMPLSAGIPGAGCPTSAHSGAASAASYARHLAVT